MANAALLNQKLQEVHLVNKLDQSGQLQLDNSVSLNVNFTQDGTRCIGKLQQTLRDKAFAGGKFTMSVELVGVFSCTGATNDEVKRQIHAEVYDQLFPFMQAHCTSLAAGSGIPGLMIRKIDMDPSSISVAKNGSPDRDPDRNPDGGPKLTLL